MATSFIVGTMSTATGWEITSPTEALARHITYWFQSRRSQGKILGNVPSFYYLAKQYGDTPEKLVEQAQLELARYIKELFPTSDVQVTKENLTEGGNNYRLIIAARVVHKDESYDLARAVLMTGSKYTLLDKERIG